MARAVENSVAQPAPVSAGPDAPDEGVLTLPLRGRRFRPDTQSGGKNQAGSFVGEWATAANWTIPCFVAGPENRLLAETTSHLLQAANSASTASVPAPSPILLMGPSGCGKTHLARGIAEAWHALLGDDQVAYLTASDFRRQVATSIADRSIGELRKQLRRGRLLVIDDLPALAGEAYALEELTHTIDALEKTGAMFLGTSNQSLADLPGFSRALLGRLLRGVTLRIAPLGTPAKRELLHHALHALGVGATPDALHKLALASPDDPHRLFAAVIGWRQTLRTGAVVDAAMVESLLKTGPKQSPPATQIIATVAKYYGLTRASLVSSSRKQTTVLARAVAIYLMREMTPLSYDQIGRLLGGRDHTTMLHNYRRIDQALDSDRVLADVLAELRRSIRALVMT